jgi:hypothetical protein
MNAAFVAPAVCILCHPKRILTHQSTARGDTSDTDIMLDGHKDALRWPDEGSPRMKWQPRLVLLIMFASTGLAQEASPELVHPVGPAPSHEEMFSTAPILSSEPEPGAPRGLLTSDRGFPHFIGYISNPEQAIDPRALTQMWPVFASTWTTAFPPLPTGDIQLYGAGLSLALSDRLSVGLSKGGYAVAHYTHDRDGWLNLGGYVQYTLIRGVPDQFLLTGGIQWEAPTGESSVFQGHGPAYLAPYVTGGKEFGDFHILSTFGFQFAAQGGTDTTNTLYGTVHFDRGMFGWFYPLVEFNWEALTSAFDPNRPTRRGFIDFGMVNATGALLTVAPGFNAVLVQDRLEVGMVYQTPIASEHNLHFQEVLMKMIIRF